MVTNDKHCHSWFKGIIFIGKRLTAQRRARTTRKEAGKKSRRNWSKAAPGKRTGAQSSPCGHLSQPALNMALQLLPPPSPELNVRHHWHLSLAGPQRRGLPQSLLFVFAPSDRRPKPSWPFSFPWGKRAALHWNAFRDIPETFSGLPSESHDL